MNGASRFKIVYKKILFSRSPALDKPEKAVYNKSVL